MHSAPEKRVLYYHPPASKCIQNLVFHRIQYGDYVYPLHPVNLIIRAFYLIFQYFCLILSQVFFRLFFVQVNIHNINCLEMKWIFFFGFFFVSLVCVAQDIETNLQIDSLLINLQAATNLQKSIEIEEVKGVHKITVWHFVPNLNYDFINNNYYLTISTSNFITNMINKRQEKRKLSAIERRYTNQMKVSELKLKSLLLSINQKLDNMKLSGIILANDVEIFRIKVQEYSNNEIDTESFLQERSSILNKIKTHNVSVSDIQQDIYQIEELTQTSVNLDLQPFYYSAEILLLWK